MRMNSRVDEIQDFIKMNVQLMIDKKGKQVTFTDQLPSQGAQTQGIKGPRQTKRTTLTMYTSTRKPWKQH